MNKHLKRRINSIRLFYNRLTIFIMQQWRHFVMSMKQLASSENLGELKKVRFLAVGGNYFIGLKLVL